MATETNSNSFAAAVCAPHPRALGDEDVVFSVRGASLVAQLPRASITAEVSPMLAALVAHREDQETMPSAERDLQGRYVLEGPVNPHAFAFLVDCVRRGGCLRASDIAEKLPDVASRLEACRNVDYYLLPGPTKMQLTKSLMASFKLPELPADVLDLSKLGLCRSEMILDRIHLENVRIRGLHVENSHVQHLTIRGCHMTDCEFSQSVTAGEVQISRSTLTSAVGHLRHARHHRRVLGAPPLQRACGGRAHRRGLEDVQLHVSGQRRG